MCILLLEIRLIRFNSTEVFEEGRGKGLLANFFFFPRARIHDFWLNDQGTHHLY